MDYFIVSQNHKVYIRLDKNGTPVTCGINDAQRFESSKAKNIAEHLPKK